MKIKEIKTIKETMLELPKGVHTFESTKIYLQFYTQQVILKKEGRAFKFDAKKLSLEINGVR